MLLGNAMSSLRGIFNFSQKFVPFAGRSRGSLRSILATSSDSASGTSGRRLLTVGTSSYRISASSAENASQQKAALRSDTHGMQPSAKISALGLIRGLPLALFWCM